MLWFHSHDFFFFLTKAASVADTVAVNPNGIKTLSANGLNTFFINDKPGFSNGQGSLPKNSPNCTTSDSWVLC